MEEDKPQRKQDPTMRKDVTLRNYRGIISYIRENQPVKNKSHLTKWGGFDYQSIKIVLDILRQEDRLIEDSEGIKLKEVENVSESNQ